MHIVCIRAILALTAVCGCYYSVGRRQEAIKANWSLHHFGLRRLANLYVANDTGVM